MFGGLPLPSPSWYDMILDRFVQGLRDGHVRQKLQLDSNLTLDKAVKVACQVELIKNQEAERHEVSEVRSKSHKNYEHCWM